ncbi:MAG: hypothetical protein KDJ31_01895 [Candidatus Competibacteraceae bacterium]|nr:hypothetical protein [Candidatus Competibacteraceae bacterium]HRY15969.1 hypothetical protein [Candidatus Competibacteraceae bacterium]
MKYLRCEEDTPAKRKKLIREGGRQIREYLADTDLQRWAGPTRLHGLLLVYHGWEFVGQREVRRID